MDSAVGAPTGRRLRGGCNVGAVGEGIQWWTTCPDSMARAQWKKAAGRGTLRQGDRKTDEGGRVGDGGAAGGSVPSRRVSPCTLLSYEGGYHSRWPQRRRGEGEGGRGPPPLFFPPSPSVRTAGAGAKPEEVRVGWGQ